MPGAEKERALRRVREAQQALARAEAERVLAWQAAREAGATDREIARESGLRSPSSVGARLGPRG